MALFTEKELKATKDLAHRKMNDLKNSDCSDLDYIRQMQSLIILENAADEKLMEGKQCKKDQQ